MDAMRELWNDTVRAVCPEMEHVSFDMDWSLFEAKFAASLSQTGFYRYLEWVSSSLKRRKDEGSDSDTQVKRIRSATTNTP